MSVRALSWVWQNSKQKGGALLVELAIADFADDTGKAWPAVETLAKKARMSARNVNYLIEKKLKPAGLIVHKNAGPECRGGRPNVFQLPIERGEDFSPLWGERGENFSPGETHFPKGVKPISPNPSGTVNKNTHAKSRERSSSILKKRKPDPTQLEAFSRFYEVYPRHVARAAAEKAWLKLNPNAELAAVIATAALRYAEGAKDTEPRFIAHPATWLNARRWEDESTNSASNGDAKPKDLGNGLVQVGDLKMTRETYERKYVRAAN